MKISLKIFLGYFLLVGLAAWFILNVFVDEVKPGVRQVTEDALVDTANVLAELATEDFKASNIQNGNFAKGLTQYQQRATKANIWGVSKQESDYRVYITDSDGIVIFDSAQLALGQDYSKWNDVYLTLRGKYGVRSSKVIANDENSDTIMYVAAPIRDGKNIIGSLTVAKPNRTLLPFIQRAQSKIIRWGALLLALSLAIGTLFTWRFTRKINALREYAIRVTKGEKATPPLSSNDELTELALAMQTMRTELDGKQHIQNSIQHLTHELKSPMTAIQGALELISPNMPPEDQTRFLTQIRAQSTRVQTIIQNMLGLAALEHQQQLTHRTPVNLAELVRTQIAHLAQKAAARKIQIHCTEEAPISLQAEAFLLGQAIYNLLENALDFSPNNATINIHISQQAGMAHIDVSDQGAGIPDFALDKIFDKFYSLPRPQNTPNAGQKSTGLGLNFVQEVAKLHGGNVTLKNLPQGGALASLVLKI